MVVEELVAITEYGGFVSGTIGGSEENNKALAPSMLLEASETITLPMVASR